jgi:hypothetical protein
MPKFFNFFEDTIWNNWKSFWSIKTPCRLLHCWFSACIRQMYGVIQKTLVAVVTPAWEQMQKGAAQLEGKVEAAVRPAITKILQIKESVEDKIRGIRPKQSTEDPDIV